MSLEDARTSLLDSVRVRLDTQRHGDDALGKIAGLLQKYRGGCAVTVELQRPDACALLRLGEQWRVEPADDLVQSLRDQLGKDSVSLDYR